MQNRGVGYDSVVGNDATNVIQSVGFDPNVGSISGGVDTVRALGGDDFLNMDYGVGDDTVDRGEGSDQVRFDTSDDVSANCETKIQDNNRVP